MNYSPTAATFARPAPSRACGPVLLVLASRQSVAKAVQPLCDMLALQLRLHPMQAMQRLAGPPTPKDLMNFIFHAERNHHASGLIPLR